MCVYSCVRCASCSWATAVSTYAHPAYASLFVCLFGILPLPRARTRHQEVTHTTQPGGIPTSCCPQPSPWPTHRHARRLPRLLLWSRTATSEAIAVTMTKGCSTSCCCCCCCCFPCHPTPPLEEQQHRFAVHLHLHAPIARPTRPPAPQCLLPCSRARALARCNAWVAGRCARTRRCHNTCTPLITLESTHSHLQ